MTIAEFCVKRPVFAVMLIGFLLVLGVFSFRDLGVDLFPESRSGDGHRVCQAPGATPEEINTQIMLPLEEAVSSVSGLDELNFRLGEGIAPDHLPVRAGAGH